MEPRKYPLPHDIAYLVDCASEMDGITAAADIALRLYGDPDKIEAIFERNRGHGRGYLRECELELEKYSAEIINALPPARRMALLQRGLLSVLRIISDQSAYFVHATYSDNTIGGYETPSRKIKSARPTPKVARRIRSRAYIARGLKKSKEIVHVSALWKVLLTIDNPHGNPSDEDVLIADLNAQRERYRAAVLSYGLVDVLPFDVPPPQKADRRKTRQQRTVVKKAAVLAVAMFGASAVSAFAKGEPIVIQGDAVTFAVKPTSTIFASGHGAVRVDLRDPATNEDVASLCVYQDAPALDQAVSIALHAAAGEESAVLKTGNVFAVRKGQESNPILAGRKLPAAIGDLPFFQRTAFDDEHAKAMEDFHKEIFPIAEEIAATIVLGPTVSMWRKNDIRGIGRSAVADRYL